MGYWYLEAQGALIDLLVWIGVGSIATIAAAWVTMDRWERRHGRD